MGGFSECAVYLSLVGLALILAFGVWSFIGSLGNVPRTEENIKNAIFVYKAVLILALVPVGISLYDAFSPSGDVDMSKAGFILSIMFSIYAVVTSNVYRLEDKLEQLKPS